MNTSSDRSLDQRLAHPVTPSKEDADRQPPVDDDNPLESIGKAITDPIATAAEDEEPGPDGVPRVTPGG